MYRVLRNVDNFSDDEQDNTSQPVVDEAVVYPETVDETTVYTDPAPVPDSSTVVVNEVMQDNATDVVEDDTYIDPIYPGHVLSVGSNNSEVARMQTYLNALSSRQPVPYPTIHVDGVFGTATRNTVMQYQRNWGLTVDGAIGVNTWDSIVSLYNSYFRGGEQTWPGIALRNGSRSTDVEYMQSLLDMLSTTYTAITTLTLDGIYGSATSGAVRLYQKQFGLNPDGILGQNTWTAIVLNADSQATTPVSTIYPGSLIQYGSSGDSVRFVQSYLNRVRMVHAYAWPNLTIDGVFGTNTRNAVRGFQAAYGLSADGIVGPQTWSRLIAEFNTTIVVE